MSKRPIGSRARPAEPRCPLLLRLLALAPFALILLSGTRSAAAQAWSDARQDPALFEIVSIDATGEPGFPYGREDIADDGLDKFTPAEAAGDLRSLYVSTDATRLWLRSYFAGSSAPARELRVFFFIDVDGRDGTGGPAQGMELDEELAKDPTRGGYEVAVSVRGDGMLLGVFDWDAGMGDWLKNKDAAAPAIVAEQGAELDPLAIGAARHGYLQIALTHSLSGLTQSCAGTFFVRTLGELNAMDTFADDAPQEFFCHAPADAYGVPIVLQPEGCDNDEQCPGEGRCQDGVCLIAYPCAGDQDCPNDHRCMQDRCVRVVSGSCDDAADCHGLVCENMRCVACTESGARACEKGLTCAPDGSCVDTSDVGRGNGNGVQGPGKVRGGAFSCALGASAASRSSLELSLLALLALAALTRTRARRAADRGAP